MPACTFAKTEPCPIEQQYGNTEQQLYRGGNGSPEDALNGERLSAAEQGKGGTAQQNRKDLVGTEFIHGIPPR